MKIGIKWYEKFKWKEFDMKIGIKINWFENWYEKWYENFKWKEFYMKIGIKMIRKI